MPDQETPAFLEPFAQFAQFWADAMRGAPNRLTQPILPDWSFLRIDETNSSAPATEQAIVEKESYGRQLGRMMDALVVLIERQPDAHEAEEFKAFWTLKKHVDDIKCKEASDRIGRVSSDLALLKQSDRASFEAAIGTLRSVIGSRTQTGTK